MVRRNIPNGWISRLIYRSIYVVAVAFVAVTLPFFGSLLGFIGERSAPSGNASIQLIVSRSGVPPQVSDSSHPSLCRCSRLWAHNLHISPM